MYDTILVIMHARAFCSLVECSRTLPVAAVVELSQTLLWVHCGYTIAAIFELL